MARREWWIAAALSAALSAALLPAGAATRIDARRLGEVKAGMTADEVHAILGAPEMTLLGTAPGPIDTFDFVFTQWEKDGLYAGAMGLAGYGADGRLVTFGLPAAHAPTAAADARPPAGHSATLEPFARLDAYATDPAWGYGPDRPIRVGGLRPDGLPHGESAFLNALRGPGGEIVEYQRDGSCCQFDTPRGIGGRGFLDVFRLRIQGRPEPVLLYLDMYDPGPRDVPAGFTYRLRDTALRNAPLAAAPPASAAPALLAIAAAANAISTPARLDRAHCTPPPWPPESLARKESGTVTLEVQVQPDGSAKTTTLARSSGHPRLDDASLLGFAACRYIPALRDGQPVAGAVTVQYTWKLP